MLASGKHCKYVAHVRCEPLAQISTAQELTSSKSCEGEFICAEIR